MSPAFCVLLSCADRGLCDGLITRPKEFYQMFKIDYEPSSVRRPRPHKDCRATDDDDGDDDYDDYEHF
jgi:hypothetical protein